MTDTGPKHGVPEPSTQEQREKFREVEVARKEELFDFLKKEVDPLIKKIHQKTGQEVVPNLFLSGDVDHGFRFCLNISPVDSEDVLATIDWVIQSKEHPKEMNAGAVWASDDLRGSDIGLDLLLLKKKAGKFLGYEKIFMVDMVGMSGKPSFINSLLRRQAEDPEHFPLNLSLVDPKDSPYEGAGTTYVYNV